MIYLRLSGGLGNQLYQLAAASLLAQRQRAPVTAFLGGLQRYEVPRSPDSIKLLMANDWLKAPADSKQGFAQLLSVSARVGRLAPVIGVKDNNFWNAVARSRLPCPLFIDGYFQHGWTDDSFGRALAAMPITPISQSAGLRLKRGELVMHIRGGDFLKLPRFQVVHVPFYIEAVRQALQRGIHMFAVITDDAEYAATICNALTAEFPDASFRQLERASTALEDFDTLRSASARIIGNSTFAWWATALGGNKAPTWSPTKSAIDEHRDFYLKNEIPIDCSTP